MAAELDPIRNGRFLLAGDDYCPEDVLIPNWAGGRDAALDLTVVTPIQAQTLPQAAITPGHALTHAYERKMRGAEEDCRRQGIAFIPMAWQWNHLGDGTEQPRTR